MEHTFAEAAKFASLLVEAAAVLIVFFGAVDSFARLLWIVVTPGTTHGERKALGVDLASGCSWVSSSSSPPISSAASSRRPGLTSASSARLP